MKTSQVAKVLNCQYYALMYLVRTGRINPARDSSGDLLWTQVEIQRARDIMHSMIERRSGRQPASV
jgi:DNA-binding transcriptional MerR regulator